MVLEGSHPSESTPLATLRQVVLKLLSPELDPTEDLIIKAEQYTYQHSVARGVGAFLGAFFDREKPAPRVDELDQRGLEICFDVLLRLLTLAARKRPLIIGLDDLQWADELTVYFIQFLVAKLRIEEAPIGLLMMMRPLLLT